MYLDTGVFRDRRPAKADRRARPEGEALRSVARANLRARRIRHRHLPEPLFGEPAFDMLLALYLCDQGGLRQSVTDLVKYSGAPMTTALRWIDYLVKAGLVTRRANPTDRRVAFIELTDKGLNSIEAYLGELIAEGVATPLKS
jgi:DNA-binding MarR family transcriptional regulator